MRTDRHGYAEIGAFSFAREIDVFYFFGCWPNAECRLPNASSSAKMTRELFFELHVVVVDT